MSDGLEPLRGARFELRRKTVLRLKSFKDYSSQLHDPIFSKDLVEFIRRIEQGLELRTDFYRNQIDNTPDELLEKHGIKHVHLGGSNSDVLLFVAEYEDVVILLEVNDHKHFRTDPPGSLLLSLHQIEMRTAVGAAAGAAEEHRVKTEAVAERRRRLGKLKADGWRKPGGR